VQLYFFNELFLTVQTHKTVSTAKCKGFNAFMEQWQQKNVSEEAAAQCDRWLLGEAVGYKECRTTKVITGDDCRAPPFHSYHKYKVSYAAKQPESGSENPEDKDIEAMELA